jgi:hypothetical protein
MGSQMSSASGDAGLNWCVTFDRSARELSSQRRSTENTRLTLKSQGSVLRRTSVRRVPLRGIAGTELTYLHGSASSCTPGTNNSLTKSSSLAGQLPASAKSAVLMGAMAFA